MPVCKYISHNLLVKFILNTMVCDKCIYTFCIFSITWRSSRTSEVHSLCVYPCFVWIRDFIRFTKLKSK